MLSLKTTTALIAAISAIATASVASALTPQAFGQNFTNTGDVNANLNVDIKKKVDQDIDQWASASSDKGSANVDQSASQGFCEQIGVSQATAGNTAASGVSNNIGPGNASGDFSENTGIDCS
jgi:hypothetical protein